MQLSVVKKTIFTGYISICDLMTETAKENDIDGSTVILHNAVIRVQTSPSREEGDFSE